MAQQALHPFSSGTDIKLALSAACSTQFNSRGFEANYTPPWIATLQDACAFSNRLSIATEPYLSIPGGIINQIEIDTKREELSMRRRNHNAVNQAASNPPAGSSRQSDRIPLLSAQKHSKEANDIAKAELELNCREKKIREEEGNGAFPLHTPFPLNIHLFIHMTAL